MTTMHLLIMNKYKSKQGKQMATQKISKITLSLDERTLKIINRVMLVNMITSRSSAVRYIVNTAYLSEEKILNLVNKRFERLEAITEEKIQNDFRNILKKIEEK